MIFFIFEMNIHVLWHNDPQNWKLSPFLKVVKSHLRSLSLFMLRIELE